MLNNFRQQRNKILIAIGVVFCFALIRAFESPLFYDPLKDYFDSEFNNKPLPRLNTFKLFYNLLFRYVLNSILSVVLIYTLFRDTEILKFTSFLYSFFLILLFAIFFIIIGYFPDNSWILFYVRRFMIQPIFVLLFVPAFYYQQQNLKK